MGPHNGDDRDLDYLEDGGVHDDGGGDDDDDDLFHCSPRLERLDLGKHGLLMILSQLSPQTET